MGQFFPVYVVRARLKICCAILNNNGIDRLICQIQFKLNKTTPVNDDKGVVCESWTVCLATLTLPLKLEFALLSKSEFSFSSVDSSSCGILDTSSEIVGIIIRTSLKIKHNYLIQKFQILDKSKVGEKKCELLM